MHPFYTYVFDIDKYFFEYLAGGSVVFNKRIGCLDPVPPPNAQVTIDSLRIAFETFFVLGMLGNHGRYLPIWKTFSKALNSVYEIGK